MFSFLEVLAYFRTQFIFFTDRDDLIVFLQLSEKKRKISDHPNYCTLPMSEKIKWFMNELPDFKRAT